MDEFSNREKIMQEMGQELLALLQRGDVLIIQDVAYFECHVQLQRVRAESLYSLFERWAFEEDIAPSERNFCKILFNTMSWLNAMKKIQVRVTKGNSALCVILNSDLPEV